MADELLPKDRLDQKLKALDSFKDWSNYLLVTTVAALGWTSTKAVLSSSPRLKSLAIASFALSIVFAILTLALVPHVGEDITSEDLSIYQVYWSGWGVRLRLTRLCLPQHLFFLSGILLYAAGTGFPRHPLGWLMLTTAVTLCLIYILGRPKAEANR